MRAKYTKSDRAMQLFYDPDFVPPLHTLGEEESRHCVRVLRLAEGDSLHLTDGRGTLYRCRIVSADPRRCTVEAVETVHDFEPLPYRLVMGVAPTKNADRFEWFLEKATEVGVTAIVPLETDHSERRVFRSSRRPSSSRSRRSGPSSGPSHPCGRCSKRRSRGAGSSPTATRLAAKQANNICPRRCIPAKRPWCSSVPRAISRPAKSTPQ